MHSCRSSSCLSRTPFPVSCVSEYSFYLGLWSRTLSNQEPHDHLQIVNDPPAPNTSTLTTLPSTNHHKPHLRGWYRWLHFGRPTVVKTLNCQSRVFGSETHSVEVVWCPTTPSDILPPTFRHTAPKDSSSTYTGWKGYPRWIHFQKGSLRNLEFIPLTPERFVGWDS